MNLLLRGERKLESADQRVPVDNSMKRGCQAKRTKDEHPSSRLVKIELDAAEALAEFSHIAHLPRQDKSGLNSHDSLQWSGKRKRSVRVGNSQAGPGCLEEGEATFMSSKAPKFIFNESKFFYATKGSFPIEERDEFSKESSLQVNQKAFLLEASSAKSAFQRVLPMIPLQIPCHPPINIKIEDGCTDVNPAPTAQVHRVAVKKNPRIRRPPVSVKLKQLGEQEANMKEPKDTGHQSLIAEGQELKPSVNSALEGSRQGGLRVVSKPKAALTEMEKEARRLRRVQANRESARQTIRRKQILCEELKKRAACLALENESMKQKKGLLMQELCSLKNWNRHLKQQLTIEPSCHESFQESSTMPLQKTVIPASQVPSLPTSGVPVPSLALDMSVAVVNIGNQMPLLHSDIIMSGVDGTVKGTTNDTSQSFEGNRQHQSSMYMRSQSSDTCITNQVCTSDVAQQTTTCHSKGSCSLRTSAQKEMGSVAAERDTPVKLEMLHYDPYSAIKNPEGASENVINSIVCGDAVCQPHAHARSSSPQLAPAFPALSCTSNSEAPGTSMATSRRLNYCFNGVPAQLSWAFNSYGGSQQTRVFIVRETSAAAVAAAEARRRRKELTRSKILHSRTFRLLC